MNRSKSASIEEKWKRQSEALRLKAEGLPHGKEKDALLKMARQLETASQINQWISSPGLKPPTGDLYHPSEGDGH